MGVEKTPEHKRARQITKSNQHGLSLIAPDQRNIKLRAVIMCSYNGTHMREAPSAKTTDRTCGLSVRVACSTKNPV